MPSWSSDKDNDKKMNKARVKEYRKRLKSEGKRQIQFTLHVTIIEKLEREAKKKSFEKGGRSEILEEILENYFKT